MSENRMIRPGKGDRTNNPNTGSEENQENKTLAFMKKYPLFATILISLTVLIVVYLWQDFSAKRERSRVINAAAAQVNENTHEMLRLISRPMVWSIRAELLRGNREQIDLLISDMVREQNFENIFVTDNAGEIIISTTKRQEGQNAASFIEPEMVAPENTTLFPGDNNTIVLSAPILGFDRRLGTLVIQYAPQPFELSSP